MTEFPETSSADDERAALVSALDEALTEVTSRLTHAGMDGEFRQVALGVRDVLLEVLSGQHPRVSHPLRGSNARRVVQALRVLLSRKGGVAGALAPWSAVRLANALSYVEAQLAADGQPWLATTDDESARLAPIVEVAHDLRSPLAAVLFLLDMLHAGRSGPVNAVQLQQLRMIHGSILALNQVACDLIDFVRGSEQLDADGAVVFSISGMLHAVVDIVQPMADERVVSLDVIASDSDQRLGRSSILSRVMLNLVVNAVQYADRGVVMLQARETTKDSVEFSVWDGGRSIPAPVLPHLFNAFRPNGASQHAVFSSSGLGLAVSHRLVAALGGVLTVDSGPAVGTRFRFTIELLHA